jgi:hypothetical protein
MGYVVVHRATNRLMFNDREFPTERGAKIALTRACNRDGYYPLDYCVMDADEYYDNIPMVERVNLMSGEKYMEKANTPSYMSPSCESYWSM